MPVNCIMGIQMLDFFKLLGQNYFDRWWWYILPVQCTINIDYIKSFDVINKDYVKSFDVKEYLLMKIFYNAGNACSHRGETVS